jgi:hypothetical protein
MANVHKTKKPGKINKNQIKLAKLIKNNDSVLSQLKNK